MWTGPMPRWLYYAIFRSNHPHIRWWPLIVLVHWFDLRPNLRRSRRKLCRRLTGTEQPMLGHVHLPKTGGNYVDSLVGQLPHVNLGHVVIRRDRTDRYTPVGLTALYEKKIRGLVLFSSVRNPLKFLVSHYYRSLGAIRSRRNPNFYDYELAGKGFEPLLDAILQREDSWPGRRFLFPQLFDQNGRCIVDWVHRNEQLDADLARMAAAYGIDLEPQQRVLVAKKKKSEEEHYSEPLRAKIEQIYWREMRLFGYQGFGLGDPAIPLQPVAKDRISYEYESDRLWVDGELWPRESNGIA